MTDRRQAAGKAGTPFVPVYAGEIIVGRAYETPDREWAARMSDGTPLGVHGALIDAQAVILARHHAPGARKPLDASSHSIP